MRGITGLLLILIVVFLMTILILIAILLAGRSKTTLNTPGQNPLVNKIMILDSAGGRVSWPPDGQLIAFDRKGKDGYFDIWSMKGDGSEQKCLTCANTQLPTGNIGNPEWHPSGEYLIFQAQDTSLDLPRSGDLQHYTTSPGIGINNNLWMMSSVADAVWQLTTVESGRGTLHPHFSRNGDKLIWSEVAMAGQAAQVMKLANFIVVNGQPQLSNIKPLEVGNFAFYETHGFSPDGKKILFSACPRGGYFYDLEIYTLDLDTSQLVQLTNNDEWDEHAHYSPDGTKIIYSSSEGVPQTKATDNQELLQNPVKLELWLMNANGSGRQRLTYINDPNAPEYVDHPIGGGFGDGSWNPYGREFVVKLRPGKEAEMLVLIELRDLE